MNFRQLAMRSPRERMNASMAGMRVARNAVEVRGINGELQQLIDTTLYAPTIGTQVTGGPMHITSRFPGFDPRAVKPIGAKQVRYGTTIYPGPQVVRGNGLCGLGAVMPVGTGRGMATTVSTVDTGSSTSTSGGESTLPASPAMFSSRFNVAPRTTAWTINTPEAPIQVRATVQEGTTPPVYTGGDRGSSDTGGDRGSSDTSAPGDTSAPDDPPGEPLMLDGRGRPATVGASATAAPASSKLPMILGGGALLFGAVWYFTKR
jgi:hypothetical protein